MKYLFFLLGLVIVCAVGALPARAGDIMPPVGFDPQSCEAHLREQHAGLTLDEQRAAMAAELVDYSRLAEEALSIRAGAIGLYRELKTKIDAKQALSGRDLKRLNEGAALLLAQRDALMKVAEAHECWVYAPVPENPDALAIRATGVSMSLSAALLLYDNFLIAVVPFRQEYGFRQHFNRADSGFDIQAGTLNKMTFNYDSVSNRLRARNALEWWGRYAQSLKPAPFEQYDYLTQLILQSPSQALVRKASLLSDFSKPFAVLGSLTVDGLFSLKNEGVGLTSLLFGNTVGLVETRRGKLYGNVPLTDHVTSNLRAGDIMLEKTPFRLTDRFIPGHWGHAAIWIGSEAELRELGIWDHPVVRPRQAAIRKGRAVVEALRSGVEMNPLSQFLNVDDLAVLREDSISPERRAEIILYTLRQVGKAYDFNFDAETTHRIFCSKLVYLAYGDLQWPTSRMLNKTTITPDDIALRSLGDGPLDVVLLYLDGEPVQEQPRLAMQRVIKPEKLARSARASVDFSRQARR